MKTATLQLKGWRDRTPEEKAPLQARLRDVMARRDQLWAQVNAIWKESKELGREERVLRRQIRGKVRGTIDIAISFDGVNDPKVVPADNLDAEKRDRLVEKAWRLADTSWLSRSG